MAFFSGGAANQVQALKKVTVRGGAPVTIASLQELPAGACWSADGNIRLSLTRGPMGGPGSLQSVFVIAGAEGSPQPIPALAAADRRSYGWPDVLPDGKHMLISVRTGPLYSDAHVDVTSLDGHVVRTVVDNGYHARYVASGHIVYMFARNLMAVPFDLSTLRPTGSPVMIAESIGSLGVARGVEDFDVSQTGVLVHGGVMSANAPRRAMVWVDRTGREEAIPAAQRAYTYPRISPDGSRVAIDIRDQANDIWIWDLNRHNLSRVTTNPSQDYYPVWTPDGTRLVFTSQRGGNFNLYVQNADGTGDADRLTESSNVQAAHSITPDGTQVVFREQSLQTGDDLMAVSMNDLGTPPKQRRVVALVHTNFNERNGEVSPDGRWLAYESDESGRQEVYVRPFPNTAAGRWTISSDGGSRAVWARNGRELFYVVGTNPAPIHLMRVAVDTTKGFSASVPQQLFEGRYYVDPSPTVRGRTYDVAPDGQRFIMVKDMESPERPPTPQQLVVVLNWQEELKQRVPTR